MWLCAAVMVAVIQAVCAYVVPGVQLLGRHLAMIFQEVEPAVGFHCKRASCSEMQNWCRALVC